MPDDDLTPEGKAEVLADLFNDALGQLAARYSFAGTLDELVEGFKDGSVILQFSIRGLDVLARIEPPASPN
jgi:hypothetical protein